MVLRQRHTEGAILYEKKLKPFLKSLNEGKGKCWEGAAGPSSPSSAPLVLRLLEWFELESHVGLLPLFHHGTQSGAHRALERAPATAGRG